MPTNDNLRQLIEENLRTKNTYLDLRYCGLDGTEPELSILTQCTHLETLVLSDLWENEEQRWLAGVGKTHKCKSYNFSFKKHAFLKVWRIFVKNELDYGNKGGCCYRRHKRHRQSCG